MTPVLVAINLTCALFATAVAAWAHRRGLPGWIVALNAAAAALNYLLLAINLSRPHGG